SRSSVAPSSRSSSCRQVGSSAAKGSSLNEKSPRSAVSALMPDSATAASGSDTRPNMAPYSAGLEPRRRVKGRGWSIHCRTHTYIHTHTHTNTHQTPPCST
ncbi:hypothetical protein Vafri_8763, partial [Volvox africanus]